MHKVCIIGLTVPMAPFTRRCFVSTILRNITRAPTDSVNCASKPAVKLLSLLYLSSSFCAFLDRLHDEEVSPTYVTGFAKRGLICAIINI